MDAGMSRDFDDSVEKSAVLGLFTALRGGDARALGRAVSLVEDGAAGAAELLALCRAALVDGPRALRVGITGPAGAGKSTLVDSLTRELLERGKRVGIVAVDPSSAFTGGAVLGDRIRMAGEEAGVYFRSMATRGHLGGLAAATADVLDVVEASDKDVLLIETTGVGQGEIEVVGLADVVALVLVPGMGDSVQALKAGVLEIASVFVLNKADGPGVDRLEGEIREIVALSGRERPVVRTVATSGEGTGELWGVIEELVLAQGLGTKALKLDAGAMREAPVLDHLGIAVRSIEGALGVYRALGMAVGDVEEVAQERVRVAMLQVGESRIELLEATEPDSVIGRFLAKRGEGLHHVALRVPDLAAAVEGLRRAGVRLVSETVQVGAGGHRYVFVHPASAGGVLLELVEGRD